MIAEVEGTPDAVYQPEVRPLRQLLDEIEWLLLLLPPQLYRAPHESHAHPLGWHIENCLNRVAALISADPPHPIVYVTNQLAGAKLEAADALEKTRDLAVALESWPRMPLDAVVCVHEVMWPVDEPARGWSSLRDEIASVTGHLIHQQRTVARVLINFGIQSPEGFGCMSVPPLRARSSVPPAWSLVELLDELGTVLMQVPADRYTFRDFSRTSGSVGEHIRHCLDHIGALLTAEPQTVLSYDKRRRGTAIETDPAAAIREIMRLKASLARWPAQSLDQPILVTSLLSTSGVSVTGQSTLGRELAFIISHTIHHHATVALLLERHGLDLPDRFGHSPSTPQNS